MYFDSNKLARVLEKCGLTQDAADALIEAVEESRGGLATTDQLDELERKIMSNVDVISSRFETNINKLIAEQKVSQAQEINKLIAEQKVSQAQQAAQLSSEIHSTVYKIVGMLGGLIVLATFAATIAAFLFRHPA